MIPITAKIKEEISKGNIKQAMKDFKELPKSRVLENKLIILEKNYHCIYKEKLLGLSDQTQAENQLIFQFLNLLDYYEQEFQTPNNKSDTKKTFGLSPKNLGISLGICMLLLGLISCFASIGGGILLLLLGSITLSSSIALKTPFLNSLIVIDLVLSTIIAAYSFLQIRMHLQASSAKEIDSDKIHIDLGEEIIVLMLLFSILTTGILFLKKHRSYD